MNYSVFNEVRALIGTDRTFGLLSDFARDLEHRFQSDAPGELAFDAHTTISSAGIFGFGELVLACRELEEACRTGREAEVPRARLDQARRDTLDEIDWLRIAA